MTARTFTFSVVAPGSLLETRLASMSAGTWYDFTTDAGTLPFIGSDGTTCLDWGNNQVWDTETRRIYSFGAPAGSTPAYAPPGGSAVASYMVYDGPSNTWTNTQNPFYVAAAGVGIASGHHYYNHAIAPARRKFWRIMGGMSSFTVTSVDTSGANPTVTIAPTRAWETGSAYRNGQAVEVSGLTGFGIANSAPATVAGATNTTVQLVGVTASSTGAAAGTLIEASKSIYEFNLDATVGSQKDTPYVNTERFVRSISTRPYASNISGPNTAMTYWPEQDALLCFDNATRKTAMYLLASDTWAGIKTTTTDTSLLDIANAGGSAAATVYCYANGKCLSLADSATVGYMETFEHSANGASDFTLTKTGQFPRNGAQSGDSTPADKFTLLPHPSAAEVYCFFGDGEVWRYLFSTGAWTELPDSGSPNFASFVEGGNPSVLVRGMGTVIPGASGGFVFCQTRGTVQGGAMFLYRPE